MEQGSEVGKATAAEVITPAEEGLFTLDTDKDGHLDTCTCNFSHTPSNECQVMRITATPVEMRIQILMGLVNLGPSSSWRINSN